MDGVSLIAARARAYVRERCTKNVDVKRKKKEWGKKKRKNGRKTKNLYSNARRVEERTIERSAPTATDTIIGHSKWNSCTGISPVE